MIILTSYLSLLAINEVFEEWNAIARITFEFIAGAALFHGLSDRRNVSNVCARSLIVVLLIGLGLCYFPNDIMGEQYVRALLVLLCLIVIAGLSTDEGGVCKFMGKSVLKYLGLISYSLYMTHAIVEKVFKTLLPVSSYSDSSFSIRVLIFGVYVITPLVVAAVTYHLVEERSRKFILYKKL